MSEKEITAYVVDNYATGYDHKSQRSVLIFHVRSNPPFVFMLDDEILGEVSKALTDLSRQKPPPPDQRN